MLETGVNRKLDGSLSEPEATNRLVIKAMAFVLYDFSKTLWAGLFYVFAFFGLGQPVSVKDPYNRGSGQQSFRKF